LTKVGYMGRGAEGLSFTVMEEIQSSRHQRILCILYPRDVVEEEEKFISSKQVKYRHTICIQTPKL